MILCSGMLNVRMQSALVASDTAIMCAAFLMSFSGCTALCQILILSEYQ